jgi:hypothetical protein
VSVDWDVGCLFDQAFRLARLWPEFLRLLTARLRHPVANHGRFGGNNKLLSIACRPLLLSLFAPGVQQEPLLDAGGEQLAEQHRLCGIGGDEKLQPSVAVYRAQKTRINTDYTD